MDIPPPHPQHYIETSEKACSKEGLKEQDEKLFITSCKPDCVKCLVLK